MTQGLDGSTYTYDAQNRLTQATRNGVTMSFAYDGLNRQVRRVVTGGPNPGSFYSVWDGWDLIEEYQRINGNWTVTSAYVYGATGLIAATYNGQVYFHFQDASGSTSHLTDASGVLREWYRYDLQGAPMFYDANNNQLSASAFGVRHLFTGQQWYPELGLYDLRNRFYSPDLGRFLQPDPIDFDGDRTNLYRYCGNNPVTSSDPLGLWTLQLGLSGTIQAGPFTGSFSLGMAFDGHGNFGWYTQPFGGVSVGGEANAGVAFFGSNADTIYGLRGPFTHAGGDLGLAADAQGEVFHGRDAVNGKIVSGFGVVLGAGAGGGIYGGVSYTNIYPLSSPSNKSDVYPPPGGTTEIDPNICPECATVERVVVTGAPADQGGPTWGNGVRVFGSPPPAVYTSNFYSYTGSGPTTLSNPFGSWGAPTGGPIGNWIGPDGGIIATSIFGPNNFYSGLDPILAVGSTGSGPRPAGIP